MIGALGGPVDFVEKREEYIPVAENILDFTSPSTGYLKSVNGRILGQAVIELGGGRKQADDTLDLSVGLDRFVHIGEKVEQGDPLFLFMLPTIVTWSVPKICFRKLSILGKSRRIKSIDFESIT